MSVVLITGCSSGFGKLAAIELARRGDTVFASMRDLAKAGSLLDDAKTAGVAVEVVALDVTDRASVDAAVADVIRRAGRIDVLVNNAGAGIHGAVEDADDDEVARIFETNVFGLIRVTRAVLPQMRVQGGGTVVNVGSLAGKLSPPFGGIYAASKHAVEALSDALHYELHPFGVRVVLVEPGAFETEFSGNVLHQRRSGADSPYASLDARFAEALDRIPVAGLNGGRQDARVVAGVIADAAHAEQPKRRYLVGADAEMLGGLLKQLPDEDFERTMRTTLDFWD
jgi:NAD(P)-dependent dehydrogenase (short-subunit alcohol dehydrogenase family)